jgi:hypothetical protein
MAGRRFWIREDYKAGDCVSKIGRSQMVSNALDPEGKRMSEASNTETVVRDVLQVASGAVYLSISSCARSSRNTNVLTPLPKS